MAYKVFKVVKDCQAGTGVIQFLKKDDILYQVTDFLESGKLNYPIYINQIKNDVIQLEDVEFLPIGFQSRTSEVLKFDPALVAFDNKSKELQSLIIPILDRIAIHHVQINNIAENAHAIGVPLKLVVEHEQDCDRLLKQLFDILKIDTISFTAK